MKKTMLLALLTCEIMAMESGPYIGLYGGQTELKGKVSNGTYSAEKNKEGNSGEIKIGYYVDNHHHRVHAFYQTANHSAIPMEKCTASAMTILSATAILNHL